MTDVSRRARPGLALLVVGLLLVSVPLAFDAAGFSSADRTYETPENRTLVGIQQTGTVSMYHPDGRLQWRTSNAYTYFDVTYLNDSYVLAAFVGDGYSDCGPYASPCYRTGARLLRTDGGRVDVVREYSFPVRSKHNSEVHDVELLPDGRLLVADMDHERVYVTDWNGTEGWSWNASSYYDRPADPTRTDWLHINDVDRIRPGYYMLSVRNTNQILFVERGEGVVEVVNEDRSRDLLYRQHNPQWLGNGSVLVADSHNDRVVELHRNDSTGEWEVAWSLYSAGGYAFDWPRDADRLPNGHTLVADTRNQRVVAVTENGTTVWSLRLPVNVYEADRLPGERLYRDGHAPRYDAGNVSGEPARPQRVPVFTDLRSLLSYTVHVPVWVRGRHLLLGTLGALIAALGGVVEYRAGE